MSTTHLCVSRLSMSRRCAAVASPMFEVNSVLQVTRGSLQHAAVHARVAGLHNAFHGAGRTRFPSCVPTPAQLLGGEGGDAQQHRLLADAQLHLAVVVHDHLSILQAQQLDHLSRKGATIGDVCFVQPS